MSQTKERHSPSGEDTEITVYLNLRLLITNGTPYGISNHCFKPALQVTSLTLYRHSISGFDSVPSCQKINALQNELSGSKYLNRENVKKKK